MRDRVVCLIPAGVNTVAAAISLAVPKELMAMAAIFIGAIISVAMWQLNKRAKLAEIKAKQVLIRAAELEVIEREVRLCRLCLDGNMVQNCPLEAHERPRECPRNRKTVSESTNQ